MIHGVNSQEKLIKQNPWMGRSETLPYLQKEWMSMLKTHEGESKIKPKKGEKC